MQGHAASLGAAWRGARSLRKQQRTLAAIDAPSLHLPLHPLFKLSFAPHLRDRSCVRLTSLLDVVMLRNTFVTSLARFTMLHSPASMKLKHARAFR